MLKQNRVIIAEYIWLGCNCDIHSKTKVFSPENSYLDQINNYPIWNYDGSSTGQAEGTYSEIILKPRVVYKNPFHKNHDSVLVLCDTYDKDDNPSPSNTRYSAALTFSSQEAKESKPWFGIEQEYFLFPLSSDIINRYSDSNDKPRSQGDFYCSVGTNRAYDRQLVEEHMFACIDAGIKISGINAEVAPGQWEYQVGPCEGIESGDQLWISRWIMERISEKYNIKVIWDPKPLEKFNGSGCHTNYSTINMRNGDKEHEGIYYIFEAIKKLKETHNEHMKIYGKDNDKRMSGNYETSNYDNFTFDITKPVNRGASIRISYNTLNEGKGYFEDRRPASNMDPYLVTEKIFITTVLN